jgi:hypothetical protein
MREKQLASQEGFCSQGLISYIVAFSIIILHAVSMIFYPFHKSPNWARAPSFSSLHDHIHLHTPHSVGLLWTSDQPIAETST